MDRLSPEEISEFREIFSLVDKDGGGTISKVELGELMETLGIEATAEDIEHMITEIDKGYIASTKLGKFNNLFLVLDGSGEINFEEFVEVMSRKVNATYTADQVKVAFKVFETHNLPGKIRADALSRALCTYGVEKLTEEQGDCAITISINL